MYLCMKKIFLDKVIIPPNPHHKKIMSDLLTFGPVEKQFETNEISELYEKQKVLDSHFSR